MMDKQSNLDGEVRAEIIEILKEYKLLIAALTSCDILLKNVIEETR